MRSLLQSIGYILAGTGCKMRTKLPRHAQKHVNRLLQSMGVGPNAEGDRFLEGKERVSELL